MNKELQIVLGATEKQNKTDVEKKCALCENSCYISSRGIRCDKLNKSYDFKTMKYSKNAKYLCVKCIFAIDEILKTLRKNNN